MFQQETNPSNVDVVQNTTDNFFAHKSEPNSDEEQLDDRPFLSHRIADDQESFSEKFLRNILTYEYQNQMPRRREKFVEIVKTVTVTEIVNGGPDKHPSSCEVKVTNLSPSGPHPVNVSITHLNERWRSSESLESEKGTVIRIQETHQPYHSNNINNSGMKKRSSSSSYKEQESVRTKVEKSSSFNRATDYTPLFNKSSDNIIDLEFTHPHLIETTSTSKGTRAFADLRRKRVSKTTKTETTEHEKVTTTTSSNRKRSCSAQPQVRTLYYRKFIDTHNNELSDDESSQGSMIDNENRSRSAEPIPIPPPRKRLGKEESLHYYREDEEVQGGGVTSVSINDNYDHRNITAGITTVSVNDSCTDTSFESRFSTIPRTSSHHIHVNVIGPERSSEIHIDRQENRRRSSSEAPPKPPRRAKYDNATLGEPLATSTPMATIERKISRRPPDINIIECENDVKSPSRTPIVVVNQTPTSRRSSQDLLSTPAERRRKSTVTDIDWYAAFNMKEPDRKDIPIRRRASESSLAIPPADIDLNQVFICTKIRRSDDEKCQCNACRLIRLSDNERRSRSTTRQTTSTSSRIFNRTFSEFTTNTVPSRHSTPPVEIMLDDIFNPKPKRASTKDKKINLDDIFNNETYQNIDQSKVRTSTKTNKSHADQFREDNQQIQIPPQDGEIRTTTTMKITTTTAKESKDSETKKGTYIVTRKQRAQDIDAFDFDEKTRKIEVTIPIIPTEKSKANESAEVLIELNNQYKSKQENPTIEVTNDNGSIYSETTLNLDNIFNVNSTNQISETVGKNLEEHISDNTKSETVSTSSVTLTESRKYLDEKVEDEETINRPPSSPAEPIIDKTSENTTSNALSEVNILLNNELDKQIQKNIDYFSGEYDIDEKLRRRTDEFSKNKSDKKLPEVNETRTTTKSVQLLDDSNISIDDVFNISSTIPKQDEDQKEVTKPIVPIISDVLLETEENIHRPHSTPTESALNVAPTSLTKVKIELEKQSTFENLEDNTSEKPESLNLDNIFNISFTHKNDDVSDLKLQQRISEFNKNKSEKKVEQEEKDSKIEYSSNLDDSNISLDDVFNLEKDRKLSRNIEKVQYSPKNEEIEPLSNENNEINLHDQKSDNLDTEDKSALNLDDILNVRFNQNKSEDVDEKLKKRISEFEKNKSDKKHQEEPIKYTTTSNVNLDDSSISIDDVFNVSQTKPSLDDHQHEELKIPINIPDSDKPLSTEADSDSKPNEIENNPIVSQFAGTTTRNILDQIYDVGTIKDIENATHQIDNENISRKPSCEEKKKPEKEPNSVGEISQPNEPTTSVNLDEIFNVSFKHDEEDVNDEKLKNRIAEFEKNKSDKKHQEEPIKYTTTSNVNLDDSRISIDDVFNVSQRKPSLVNQQNQEVEIPINVPDSEKSTSIKADSEKNSSQQTSNLNLDEVLNVSFKHDNEDVDDGKMKQRIAEFENNKSHKKHQEEPSNYTTTSTVDLDDSQIPINNVFNVSRQMVSVDENIKPSSPEISINREVKTPIESQDSEQSTSTEVLSNTQTSEQTSNLNLDDVFNVNFKHNEDDVNDEKLKRRIAEFENNKSHKQPQETTIICNSKTKNSSNQQSPSTTSGLNIDLNQKTSANIEATNNETVQSIQIESNVNPKSIETSNLNMREIFDVSFTDDGKDVDDEKIEQRIAEFKKNTTDIKHEVGSPTTTTKSSNLVPDDSKISIDDMFNFKPNIDSTNISIDLNQQQSVNIEATKNETISDQIKTSISDSVTADVGNQPFGTTDNYHIRMKDRETSEPVIEHSKIIEKEPSSVNLDDVFNISFTQNEEDVNDSKLKKRIEEFEKNKNEKQHQVEEHPKITKSSINLDDSNISMEDVFNIDRNEQKSIFSSDVSTTKSDKPSTDSTLREKLSEDQASTKISSIEETHVPHVNVELEEKKSAEVEVTANEPARTSEILVISENSQPTTSTNTVNLEEIFNKRIAEFEKNKSDKKHQEEPIKYTTTSNVNLDDSSISIDDVFNILKSQHRLKADSEKTSSQQTSDLNLDEVLNVSFKHDNEDVDDGKLKQRIAEFENNKSHEKHQEEPIKYTTTSTVDLNDSQIPIDDVFNVSPQMDPVDENTKPSSSEISIKHNVKTPINISGF
ncbi:unnamed protein product [Caenorhabditis angaria]|uniref:Aminotransferase class I/classII domain-containing protein n=1 Tax=Caenorhabditis angaria TaxID=860376 RepID=A0A9P1ITM4_9PELO|nr:unnamed protein product [Caenorhabditis angaria]